MVKLAIVPSHLDVEEGNSVTLNGFLRENGIAQ